MKNMLTLQNLMTWKLVVNVTALALINLEKYLVAIMF